MELAWFEIAWSENICKYKSLKSQSLIKHTFHTTYAVKNKQEKLGVKGEAIFDLKCLLQSQAESTY